MEVIFIKDVPPIAKKGDIKKVAPGYARNFLLPRKLALAVTKKNVALIENEKKAIARRLAEEKKKLEKVAEQIEKMSLTFEVAVGESGKMFGSVTSSDVLEELKKKLPDLPVDKHSVVLKEPIKETGAYSVEVHLHPEIKPVLKIWVIEKK